MGIVSGGDQPVTRSEWADKQLRAAILSGAIRPGEQLVISTLAEQLGVSATPLREALRNLSAEGLVELQPHGSARVATVDITEAVDLYEMRIALEPMVLERSVAKSDEAYRTRLEMAWDAMVAENGMTILPHITFHRVLLSGCDSAWMMKVADMLADRSTLMMVIEFASPPPAYDIGKAHRHLYELAMSGDGAGAAGELASHLGSTLARFNRLLAEEAAAPVNPS